MTTGHPDQARSAWAPVAGKLFTSGIKWAPGGSTGLPVTVEYRGTQGCRWCAECRQDERDSLIVHGDEGEREVLDANVVIVTGFGLAEGMLQALLARGCVPANVAWHRTESTIDGTVGRRTHP